MVLLYHTRSLPAWILNNMEMKIDINMIKGLLIALAASFLFACAAEAQQGKQIKPLLKQQELAYQA